MKKMASLLSFLVAVVFLFSATLVMAKAVPITDISSQLKGAWTGTRCLSISNSPSRCFPTELEINNDCSPLEGALIVHLDMRGTYPMPFKNGVIDEKGRISVEWDSRTWILLTLQANGELKGECQFIDGHIILKGTLSLKKK